MAENSLAFSKLPEDLQTKILDLQNPSENRYVFLEQFPALGWLAVAAGLIFCGYMFWATQDYLWEYWMFWIFAALAVILVPLALFFVWKFIAIKSAKLKNGYIFTPNECLRIKDGEVEFWNLKELEGFQLLEDIKTIEIWIGDRVEKIKVDQLDKAQELADKFVDWRNQAGESFLQSSAQAKYAFQSGSKITVTAVGLLVFMFLGFGLSYGAKILNRRFDDSQTWKRTETSQTVADFEAYKERHPQGSFVDSANQKISDILVKSKDEYRAKTKPNADENAVKAFMQALEKIAGQPNRTIYVKVSETRDLDESVVKKMKERTGFQINSYDYSIPTTQFGYRKDKILNDMSVLFLPATKNASVKFELNDNPPPDGTVFEIGYAMKSVEVYYRYDWYSSGSYTAFYNPGAKFEFNFVLKSPEAEKLYETQYVSQFTKGLNTGVVDTRDAANYSFDKMFFSSVSEDFAKYLGKQFGFNE